MGPGSWSYDQWQDELDRVLLRERNPAEPVVLFVSREMLQENFPFFASPLDSLSHSVLETMQVDSHRWAFAPIRQRLREWQKDSRTSAPPILPLAAVTVAAAADMGADEKGGPLMYYGRLQEILGPSVTTSQLRDSFEDVAVMWRILSEWINDQPILGASTILEDSHWPKIGYARSQALMSKQDAANLKDFFYAIGREKLDSLGPGQLVSELTRWNRKYKRLTRSLTRSLEGDAKGPGINVLISVLPLLVMNWDGQPKERQTHVELRVQIRLDMDAWTASWVIPRHKGVESLKAMDAYGRELSIQKQGFGSFYIATGLPESVSTSIDSSNIWRAANTRVQMKPRKAWMFSVDPVSGDWVSMSSVDPFDEMALLIREEQAIDFAGLLDAVGVQGYQQISGHRQIVPGWDLFRRVVISGRTEDTRLFDWLGQGQASLDESAEAPRLVNGLKVRSLSGVDVYIAGGEPDLVVPATPFGTYSISLDDSREMELRANGSALPLHKLVGSPGYHMLFINESDILAFETIRVHDQSLITSFGEELDTYPNRDQTSLNVWPKKLILARSANHFIISRTGTVIRITPSEIPTWLETAGYTNGSRFEIDVPADAIWLVTKRRDRIRAVKKLQTVAVEFNFDSLEASAGDWKSLFEDEHLIERGAEWLNVVYQARRLLRI